MPLPQGECVLQRNPDPQRRFIPTLMMSAVLHPGGVGCKLVHIFHTEVKGEHHDGRSEAREGILPQVVEERVSSPRVLSSEYHCAVIYSTSIARYQCQFSPKGGKRSHDNLKRTKGGEGERPDGFRCEKRGCKHLSFPGPRTKTTSQPMWSPIPPSAGADRTGTASQPPSPSTHKCKWDVPNAFGEQPEYRGPLHRHHNTHLLFALENGTRVKNEQQQP